MSSLKFRNPGEQMVRVSLLTGQGAEFPPGQIVEVPVTMKAECLAANLTLVADKKLSAKELKAIADAEAAAAAAAEADEGSDDDDNETNVNAG
jgi:hypothetical protein